MSKVRRTLPRAVGVSPATQHDSATTAHEDITAATTTIYTYLPHPQDNHQTPESNALLLFNCSGLQIMIEKIVAFMSREGVWIAAVQETKLNSRSDLLSCAGFNVLRKDREREFGGGLTFRLHNTVQYRLYIRSYQTIIGGWSWLLIPVIPG